MYTTISEYLDALIAYLASVKGQFPARADEIDDLITQLKEFKADTDSNADVAAILIPVEQALALVPDLEQCLAALASAGGSLAASITSNGTAFLSLLQLSSPAKPLDTFLDKLGSLASMLSVDLTAYPGGSYDELAEKFSIINLRTSNAVLKLHDPLFKGYANALRGIAQKLHKHQELLDTINNTVTTATQILKTAIAILGFLALFFP
jgi:hypothetical protein